MKDFKFTREELIAIDAILMIMKKYDFIEIFQTSSDDKIVVNYGLATYNKAFETDTVSRTIPNTIENIFIGIYTRMVEHGMPSDWSIKFELEYQLGEFSMSFYPRQLQQSVLDFK